jgi:hypothetical protein
MQAVSLSPQPRVTVAILRSQGAQPRQACRRRLNKDPAGGVRVGSFSRLRTRMIPGLPAGSLQELRCSAKSRELERTFKLLCLELLSLDTDSQGELPRRVSAFHNIAAIWIGSNADLISSLTVEYRQHVPGEVYVQLLFRISKKRPLHIGTRPFNGQQSATEQT